MKTIIFSFIILSFLSLNIFAQPTVTLLKRLDDDAGRYGQKLSVVFENKPGDADKRKSMEPFVMSYFGWKAKVLTNFGVGKIEAAHLDICRIILGLYDSEIDDTLKTIISRAKTPVDWIDVPETEKKKIHQFVVIKYAGKYSGFNDLIAGKTQSQINELDNWKSMLGSGLGEIGGSLVNWYKFPKYEKYHTNIAELLRNLQKEIDKAPAGISPDLLTNLRKLQALGNKPIYNEAERDQVAAALRDVLYSTLSFAGLQNSSAPLANNSSYVSPAQKAQQFLERGKTAAAKKDFKNAVIDYNESIKLNPANGIAYYHRAKALEELGELDKAISDYHMMIAFKTDLQKAYYNRGTLYLEKKSYYLAIDDLNKSLAINPTYVKALYNRGSAYYSLNNFDSAMADYSQIIKLDPKESDAFYSRALVYCRKKQTSLAIKDQEQAIKLGAKITKGCNF